MIGDTLRAERERQKLSIKDIEKGTSIRALYIEAIENGDFKTLPGDVYTKGFIRNYANFLKIDADAAVKQYNEENHPEEVAAKEAAARAEAEAKAEQDKAYAEKEARSSRKTVVRTERPAREERRTSYSDFEARVEGSHHRQRTILMGLIAVVVIAAGSYFLLGSDDDATASKQPQTKVTTQAKKPATESAKPAKPAEPPKQEKTYTDVEVSAKFSEKCWVSVVADGQTIFEGTIQKGESKEWKASKELKLTAGNAAAVDLTFNGESHGTLGGEGEVVEKTYALNGGAEKPAAPKASDKN